MRTTFATIILGLVLCGTLTAQTQPLDGSGQDTLPGTSLAPVTAITLPKVGDPFTGPIELSGLSGFFWTRSATEAGTLAMETVPILRTEISQLKDEGSKMAKKADDQATLIRNLEGTLVVTLIIAIGEGVYNAIRK